MSNYLTCPYCGKSGFKNLVSHTRQKHGKNLNLLLKDFPNIEYEHPEYINNRLIAMRKICKTEEFSNKMSMIRKQYFKEHPEAKDKCSEIMNQFIHSGIIKLGDGYKALKEHLDRDVDFANSLYKLRSDGLKERWKKERDVIISDIIKGWTKEARERQSRITTNYLMSIHMNINGLTEKQRELWFSEKLNILFRSSWEKQLAECLFNNQIKFEYETYKFRYNHLYNYIPDFYLPHYDLFIEVKPIPMIDQEVIDKLNSVINKGKSIVLFTEIELKNINMFLNKIVEGKLHELLETREDYVATAQKVILNARLKNT